MTTHDLVAPQRPAQLRLDDLVDEYGRLRLILALLRGRQGGVAVLPLDDWMRSDMGLTPIDLRQAAIGPPFTLRL